MTEKNNNPQEHPFRILSLDGGGAKGFYTLGVLEEIEKNIGKPLGQIFDLIFGTSTGSIIAALIARGESAEKIIKLYKTHVPAIMKSKMPDSRTAALCKLAREIFGLTKVDDFKLPLGIIATNWNEEMPFIFKTSSSQAHSSKGSFVPFFGCSVADAIIASCSAYPFFNTHTVTKSNGDVVELGDGGFCANNPTLYAIAEATRAFDLKHENLRVISVGVGSYPEPTLVKKLQHATKGLSSWKHFFSKDLLQKILSTNTCSMEVLRNILFKDVKTVRISECFTEPHMATDFLEHDLVKLNRLIQKGRMSYRHHEDDLKKYLL